MSESRYGGESRSYITPSYSSESRSCSESHSCSEREQSCSSYSSKSRLVSQNRITPQYNNIEDIDQLIESLESNLPTTSYNSTRYNQALAKRKKQIAELKLLRDQAKQQLEEDKIVSEIESENEKIADAINSVKRLIKKPKKPPIQRYQNNNSYYDTSESHDTGESRW